MKNLTPEEIAYIAGFVDGEGSFQIQHRKHSNTSGTWEGFSAYFDVANTNKQVIEWLSNKLDVTVLYKKSSGNRKEVWYIRLSGRKAQELARVTLPYLIVKKDIAITFLKFPLNEKRPQKNSPEMVAVKKELFETARILNHRGIFQGSTTRDSARNVKTTVIV